MEAFEEEGALEEESLGETALDVGPVGASPASTLSATEALERLRRGEPIERVRIVGLRLRGSFSEPVRFREVTLVDPIIAKASFAHEVCFDRCIIERLKFKGQSSFEQGLNLDGSTLTRPHFRGMNVKGNLQCAKLRPVASS